MTVAEVRARVRLLFGVSDVFCSDDSLDCAIEEVGAFFDRFTFVEAVSLDLEARLMPAYCQFVACFVFRSMAANEGTRIMQFSTSGARQDGGKRFLALLRMGDVAEGKAWELLEGFIVVPATSPELGCTASKCLESLE